MTNEQLATLYRLAEMLDEGEITEAEYDEASANLEETKDE